MKYTTIRRIVVLTFINFIFLSLLLFVSSLILSYIATIEDLTSRIDILEKQNDLMITIIKTEKEQLINVEVCSTSSFKSWMDYRAITSKSSKQYKLQTLATTNEKGFRVVNDRVLVAMGPQYGPVGEEYTIIFSDGQSLDVMIGDIKHEGCNSSRDGSMIEFIVDRTLISPTARRLGNYNYLFNGPIFEIVKEELNT